MKLLINGKEEEIGLWSFVKCTIISDIARFGILIVILLAISIIAVLE